MKKRVIDRTAGVIGYRRCSTDEQAQSGLGLEAQETEIRAECEKTRGLPILALHTDAGASGKDLARPALSAALDELEGGHGSILMVSRLDRLTRSVLDASSLMVTAEKGGWALVALNTPVDMTSPAGIAMAQVMAVFSELERKLIGDRTRVALAAKRAEGVRLGRPRTLTQDVVDRIIMAKQAGQGWSEIARALNDDGVPTAQGGREWYPGTVRIVALAAGKAA